MRPREVGAALPATTAGNPGVSTAAVVAWLRTHLGDTLGVAPDSLDGDAPLAVYGMTSLVSAMLLADLEDEFDIAVDPADVPPDVSLIQVAEIAVAAQA
ncbi:phosphopantetheine binding protein [Krasilnikovia cinnamomea]|uniref:Phosphopantetheine binding protein n=1 Tax=Krasilnikovia cinnamomea TaxID=349313 RepID=A0A4Q7ZTF1_9ACTN|nr:acyl carrier protein [Krasilnikovia cinnamomea]RZU54510.1 phosphopantetheine binding protein [Krasilnikovia cinnamomea]